MFEALLLGLIVFAVGYTLVMRVMARKADVLHGEFIQSDEHIAAVPSLLAVVTRYLPKGRLPVTRR